LLLPSCRVPPTRLAGKLGTQYTSSPPLMPHNKAAAALPHHTTCRTSRQTIPHPHMFVGHTESSSLCAMHAWTEGITLQCTPPLNVWHTHHINTHGTLQSDTVVAQSQTNQLEHFQPQTKLSTHTQHNMKACMRTEQGSTGHQPPPHTHCANQCGPKAMRGCLFKTRGGADDPARTKHSGYPGEAQPSAVCDPSSLQASWATNSSSSPPLVHTAAAALYKNLVDKSPHSCMYKSPPPPGKNAAKDKFAASTALGPYTMARHLPQMD
jgi:hypothetical protein